jgi:hypothetical protein
MSVRRLPACIFLIAILAAPLLATTVPKMELPELVARADSILQGRVESVESKFEQNLVYTYVSMTIDDPLKGDRRRTVMIRQLGGKIGAMHVSVSGQPVFKAGDNLIVFLKNQQNGTFSVVGLNQGKYEVVNDFAVSNVSGVTLVDPKSGQLKDASFVSSAPLESFKAKIRSLVQ